MEYPDAGTIRRLTQKLDKEGDISLTEADAIYSLFSEESRNAISGGRRYRRVDRELVPALKEWFQAVREKIEYGLRGNFVFTICLEEGVFGSYMRPAQKAIKEYGKFEDLCHAILVDRKLYPSLPFKHLFTEIRFFDKVRYEMADFRAGMYYHPIKTESGYCTVKQIMDKFSPVMTSSFPYMTTPFELFEVAFKIASGESTLPQYSHTLGRREIRPYIAAAFMRNKGIPCMAASSVYACKSIIFVEKENEPIMKRVLKFPFERVVENALGKGIINKKMAGELLDDEPAIDFPMLKFTNESVEYIYETVTTKMMREATQETAENENAWFEQTR